MEWRPRDEWQISERPMHEALITKAEAEKILSAFGTTPNARGRKPGEPSKPGMFLLTGFLRTPDGIPMHGEGNYYREANKGRRILRSAVDALVQETMAADLEDAEWITAAVKAAHEMAAKIDSNAEAIEAAIRSTNAKIARLAEVVADTGNASLVAKLDQLERQRDGLQTELDAGADRAKLKTRLEAFTPQMVRAMLAFLPAGPKAKTDAWRRTLSALVRSITLDLDTRRVRIDYLLPVEPRTGAAPKWQGKAAKRNPTAGAEPMMGSGSGVP